MRLRIGVLVLGLAALIASCGGTDDGGAGEPAAQASHVSEAEAHAITEELLSEAAGLTTGQLRSRLQKLCFDADPRAAKKRYEASVADRRLEVRANDTGTADIMGLDMPPHVALSISRWIHKEAIKLKNLGDERTIAQLRADIYLDLLRRRRSGGKITRAGFGNLDIKATAETLTGQSEDSVELNGYGRFSPTSAGRWPSTTSTLSCAGRSSIPIRSNRSMAESFADGPQCHNVARPNCCTPPVFTPAVGCRQPTATSTTASPGLIIASPAPATLARCAVTITRSGTRLDGDIGPRPRGTSYSSARLGTATPQAVGNHPWRDLPS